LAVGFSVRSPRWLLIAGYLNARAVFAASSSATGK